PIPKSGLRAAVAVPGSCPELPGFSAGDLVVCLLLAWCHPLLLVVCFWPGWVVGDLADLARSPTRARTGKRCSTRRWSGQRFDARVRNPSALDDSLAGSRPRTTSASTVAHPQVTRARAGAAPVLTSV